jgi:hypothetical protein
MFTASLYGKVNLEFVYELTAKMRVLRSTVSKCSELMQFPTTHF